MTLRSLLVLALVAGCSTHAATDGSTLPSAVPQAASDALTREAGGAPIERISHEREGDGDLYEGLWHVDGRTVEVTVTAAGEVIEREHELAADQVPQPVRVAAIAALPKNASKITFVQLSSGNYEAETVIDGEQHEVLVSAAGQIVSDDDDGDDEDRD